MYGQDLKFVTSCKYLGIEVVAGKKLTFSPVKPLIKFRCAANTILNTQSSLSEPVLMKLLYTACVPNLTYACESIDYSSRQMHSLDVALNDCIRRIFSFNRWESVRYLRISFGYPSLTEIFHERAKSFRARFQILGNSSLTQLESLSAT